MIKVSVEFLLTHRSIKCELPAIPRIGEWVSIGESDVHDVINVIHVLDAGQDDVRVIIRVK